MSVRSIISLMEGGAASSDPYFSQVQFLLHGDGSLADSSSFGRTFTPNGSVTFPTSGQKFGSASIQFGASPSYLSCASAGMPTGNEDYTLEFWMNADPVMQGSYTGVFASNSGGSYCGLVIIASNTGDIVPYCSTAGSTWNAGGGSIGVYIAGTWTHVAIVRNSGAMKGFVGGVGTSMGSASAFYSNGNPIEFGRYGSGASGTPFSSLVGKLDEIRFTKGTARYTSNFTPPPAPF